MGSLVKKLAMLAVVALFGAVACTPPPGGVVHVVFVDESATGVPWASTQSLMDIVDAIADGNTWTVEHRNRTSGSTDMTGVDVLWVPDTFAGTNDLDRWVGLDVPTMWSHEKNAGWAAPVVDEDYATAGDVDFTEFETYGQSTGHPILSDLGWMTSLDAAGKPTSGLHTLLSAENWHHTYHPNWLGSGAAPVLRFYPPNETHTETTSFVSAATYDDGATMGNGTTAQNRRVLFGLSQYTHDILSAEGDDFIAAALRWLAATSGTPSNVAPVLGVVGDQVGVEGGSVLVDVDATDADGDGLVFGAVGLPAGLGIDAVTGEISGVIGQTAAVGSPYVVEVTVDDGRGGSDSASFSWTVDGGTPSNVAPVLDPIGDQGSGEGQVVLLVVGASDADLDGLVFGAVGLPAGLGIDAVTGEISGVADTLGVWTVTVSVDDGNGGVDSETFVWTVEAGGGGGAGPVVRYEFLEGGGATVGDSGSGAPMDLTIGDPGSVTWIPGGGLRVDASTVIASAGASTKVIGAVQASNEITVEAWVRPAPGSQSGPARIVTNAANPYVSANFMLGQGGWGSLPADTYATRLKASGSSSTSTTFTPSGTAGSELTHVVLTRDAGGSVTIYVDGVAEATRSVRGDFSNWNASYPLVLANEATGNRPWLGTLCEIAIYDSALSPTQVTDNHTAGCDLAAPTP
jgi:hypothetical protein